MLIALFETTVNPSQVLDGSTTDPGTDICKRALLHARWYFEDKNDGLRDTYIDPFARQVKITFTLNINCNVAIAGTMPNRSASLPF